MTYSIKHMISSRQSK